MMTTLSPIPGLFTGTILILFISYVKANGYHYDPPAPQVTPIHLTSNRNTGHYNAPPVTNAHTLIQVHPQTLQRPQIPIFTPKSQNSFSANFPLPNFVNGPSPPNPPPSQIGFRYRLPTAATGPSPAVPQAFALHVGKQPTSNYGEDPDNQFYVVEGRRLKQYAVVEFGDNDISQDTKPFLTPTFFNNYRAAVGQSGIGALSPLPSAMQLQSKAHQILLEQQRFALAQDANRRNDMIALGSGGIGFLRLPDGTVSLGSGSLNFVTAQQHLEDLRNVRTRSELIQDALHFGHGPLGEKRKK